MLFEIGRQTTCGLYLNKAKLEVVDPFKYLEVKLKTCPVKKEAENAIMWTWLETSLIFFFACVPFSYKITNETFWGLFFCYWPNMKKSDNDENIEEGYIEYG